MADRQLTLFELHFDGDVQFGPESIGTGGAEEAPEEEEAEASGGSPAAKLGVAVLVAVVALVLSIGLRRLLGGRSEPDVGEVDVPT